MINVVYIAHSKERILRDTKYAILSLLYYRNECSVPFHVLLYTDSPDYYKGMDLEVRQVSRRKFTEWKGAADFIHRIKIKVLQDVADSDNGHLFYLDGDTLFRKNPEPIFAALEKGKSFMHVSEGSLREEGTPVIRKLNRFIRSNNPFTIEGETVNVAPEQVMYNAGVLGISEGDKHLLDKVLEYADYWYDRYPKHVMEQLAFSYLLSIQTQVKEAGDYIYHWWGRGLNVEKLLINFFEKNGQLPMPELAAAANAYVSDIEKAPPNAKKGLLKKIKEKLLGRS